MDNTKKNKNSSSEKLSCGGLGYQTVFEENYKEFLITYLK